MPETLPRGIALFTQETEEFADFFAFPPSGGAVPRDGVVIRYRLMGRFGKTGITALLLFFAAALTLLPEISVPGAVICAGAAAAALWSLILSRFDEKRIFLDAEKMIVRRWRYCIPGRKTTVIPLAEIRSAEHSGRPHIPKSGPAHHVRIEMTDSRTLTIVSDISAYRVSWLAEALSSWQRSGGGWRQLVRKKKKG